MSKNVTFPIHIWQENIFFSPIRSKKDYVVLLLNAIKYLRQYNNLPGAVAPTCQLFVKVASMQRMFFLSESKSFSIALPFTVVLTDSQINFFSKGLGRNIESVDISNAMLVLNSVFSDMISDYHEKFLETSGDLTSFIEFFKELISSESGYLRFDHDPTRVNGHLHPLKHIDFFYSPSATFKTGMHGSDSSSCIIDIVDTETDCRYLRIP